MNEYKEMYLTLFRATERAINILISAQRECEELYLSMPEPDLKVLPMPPAQENTPDRAMPLS